MAEMVTSQTTNPDNLIAGSAEIVPGAVTISNGEGALARGSVLGKCTSGVDSGQWHLVDSTASDGSQNPDCILAEAVDATSANAVAGAYFTGEFNENELTFGGYDTADTHRAALREKGIFLRDSLNS